MKDGSTASGKNQKDFGMEDHRGLDACAKRFLLDGMGAVAFLVQFTQCFRNLEHRDESKHIVGLRKTDRALDEIRTHERTDAVVLRQEAPADVTARSSLNESVLYHLKGNEARQKIVAFAVIAPPVLLVIGQDDYDVSPEKHLQERLDCKP